MDAQNLFTSTDIRERHYDPPVKASRTQKGRIKHIRPVGGGDQNNSLIRLKAIHLHQQLVQSLLAFIVPAAQASATVTADSINFVDEDDAGRILLSLLKQVADPACAHAHKHFNKV